MPRPKGAKNKKVNSKTKKVVSQATIEKVENGYLVRISFTDGGDNYFPNKEHIAVTLKEAVDIAVAELQK